LNKNTTAMYVYVALHNVCSTRLNVMFVGECTLFKSQSVHFYLLY